MPYAVSVGRRGRARKRRKKARYRKTRKQAKHYKSFGSRFSVALNHLEIAKGHDGLMRGAPEPVILLAAYMLESAGARLLARTIYRVDAPKKFPCKVEPREQDILTAYYKPTRPGAVLLLGLAVEEDNSTGVSSLFADLEKADSLSLWPQFFDVPEPLDLAELLFVSDAWQQPRRVDIMYNNQFLSERCTGDKWIGACAFVAPIEHRRADVVRMHFVSADERNDWSAQLSVHN